MTKLMQLLNSRGTHCFESGALSDKVPVKGNPVEEMPYLNLRKAQRSPWGLISLMKALMHSKYAETLNERLVESEPEVAPRQFKDLKQFSLAEAVAEEKAETRRSSAFFRK